MKTLKQSKLTGKVVKCEGFSCGCSVTVEIETSKGTEHAEYVCYADAPGEKYLTRKIGETVLREINLWDNTCTCDGYANGYECRHLRMVKALRKAGKLN